MGATAWIKPVLDVQAAALDWLMPMPGRCHHPNNRAASDSRMLGSQGVRSGVRGQGQGVKDMGCRNLTPDTFKQTQISVTTETLLVGLQSLRFLKA